jgi:hypothetical protein
VPFCDLTSFTYGILVILARQAILSNNFRFKLTQLL